MELHDLREGTILISSPRPQPLSPVDRDCVRFDVIWIVVVVVIFVAARLLRPSSESALIISRVGVTLPELCSLRRLLGVDCPGCGLTRCFVFAIRLRLTEAWAMHPIGVLLFVYLAASVPQRLWRVRRRLTRLPTRPSLAWELGLVIFLSVAAYIRWAALWLGMIG